MASSYEPSVGATPVELGGPGIVLESPGVLVVHDHPRVGLSTRVSVSTNGRDLVIGAIAVVASNSAEVTTNDLRNIRLVELVREHLPGHVAVHSMGWRFPPRADVASAVRGTWPGETASENVAQTYNFARALRLAPIKAITDGYGVSRATAHRWVNLCRERGLISHG